MAWARLACLLACGAALPASAGERDVTAPRFAADGVPTLSVSANVLVMANPPAGARRSYDFPVTVKTPATLPSTLVAFETLPMAQPIVVTIAAPSDTRHPFALERLRVLAAWLPADNLQVTSTRGGAWAVTDILADHRKPRFRRSALGATLMLRVDGREESPPLSVGGGGVAAALWRVMPRD